MEGMADRETAVTVSGSSALQVERRWLQPGWWGLAAQRQALLELGVTEDRIYTDHGLTGTTRARPGLHQALAAVRQGDILVVPKLYRLAGSVPDARAIAVKGVEGQGKCPVKCSAKMSLDYVAMVPDVGDMGTVRERRFGGPPAPRYFLMVDLWIPNSRSIARNDMPLRLAFWTAFHRSFWRKVGLRGATVSGGTAAGSPSVTPTSSASGS